MREEVKRLDKETRSETISAKGMQEREIGKVQRKDKRISPQRSKRGGPHQRRVPSSRGKGLDHDNGSRAPDNVRFKGCEPWVS